MSLVPINFGFSQVLFSSEIRMLNRLFVRRRSVRYTAYEDAHVAVVLKEEADDVAWQSYSLVPGLDSNHD